MLNELLRNELFRVYKKIIICVLLILSAVIFWFFGCHRQKTPTELTPVWERHEFENGGYGYEFETAEIKGRVIFGIQGYMVKDKNIPVTVSVEAVKKDFSGIVKISLPGADGGGIAYQSVFTCKKGMMSNISLKVPQLGNSSFFMFEIIDQYGSEILSKMEASPYAQWNSKEEIDGILCIGVLSGQFKSLSYLNGLILDTSEGRMKLLLVGMDSGSFPDSISKMSVLSGVLIDRYQTNSLSKKQQTVLKNWVKQGGNLILGTGVDAAQVFTGILKKSGVICGETKTTKLYFEEKASFSGEVNASLNDIHFNEEAVWKKANWSDPESYYIRDFGAGTMEVLSFSLTDEAFQQWNRRDDLGKSLFESLVKRHIADETDVKNGEWYMKKALYAFTNSQMPNTFYYGVFFICYLFFLSFISYYILRNMKKQECIWLSTPLLAICFTLLLVLRSRGSSSQQGNALSAIRFVDDASEENDIFFLYQNIEGERRTINLIPEIKTVEPLDYEYRQENMEHTSVRKISENCKINNKKEGYELEFDEASPGTMRLFQMTENKLMNYAEKTNVLSGDLIGTHTSFYGKAKNLSEQNFDKVIFIRGNQYWTHENVKKGHTMNISKDDVRCWSENEEGNKSLHNILDNNVTENITEYLIYSYIKNNEDLHSVIAIGISSEDSFQLLADGEKIGNHISVYVNHLPIRWDEKAECTVNINPEYSKVDDKDSRIKEDQLLERETEVDYQFDPHKIVWALIRNRDSFRGTIYAYNYNTKKNDVILSKWDEIMYCEELEPYVSEMNEMKITYSMAQNSEYFGTPVISLLMKKTK